MANTTKQQLPLPFPPLTASEHLIRSVPSKVTLVETPTGGKLKKAKKKGSLHLTSHRVQWTPKGASSTDNADATTALRIGDTRDVIVATSKKTGKHKLKLCTERGNRQGPGLVVIFGSGNDALSRRDAFVQALNARINQLRQTLEQQQESERKEHERRLRERDKRSLQSNVATQMRVAELQRRQLTKASAGGLHVPGGDDDDDDGATNRMDVDDRKGKEKEGKTDRGIRLFGRDDQALSQREMELHLVRDHLSFLSRHHFLRSLSLSLSSLSLSLSLFHDLIPCTLFLTNI